MKRLVIVLLIALALCAQNAEVVQLTDAESSRLRMLDSQIQSLRKVEDNARKEREAYESKLFSVLREIRISRKLNKVTNECRGTSGTSISTCIPPTWEPDKSMRFLVKY